MMVGKRSLFEITVKLSRRFSDVVVNCKAIRRAQSKLLQVLLLPDSPLYISTRTWYQGYRTDRQCLLPAGTVGKQRAFQQTIVAEHLLVEEQEDQRFRNLDSISVFVCLQSFWVLFRRYLTSGSLRKSRWSLHVSNEIPCDYCMTAFSQVFIDMAKMAQLKTQQRFYCLHGAQCEAELAIG